MSGPNQDTRCCYPLLDRPMHQFGAVLCGFIAAGPDPDPEISYRRCYCKQHLAIVRAEYAVRVAEESNP